LAGESDRANLGHMNRTVRADVDAIEENQQVFGFLLALHGLVHVLGFAISWRFFEVFNMRYEDVWPDAGTWPGRLVGLAWLAAAVLLGVFGARLAVRRSVGRRPLAAAVTFSLLVTLTAAPAALPGTTVSGTILLAMAVLAIRRATHSPASPPSEERQQPDTGRGRPRSE